MSNFKTSLSAVNVTAKAKEYVNQALDAGEIGQTAWIERFEDSIKRFTGARYAIAVSSGTMADAVLLQAIKELHNVSTVIVPALTFIAQPNAARMCGLDVKFVDVGRDMLMDFSQIKNVPINDAPPLVFVNDTLGRVPDYSELISKGYLFAEDACEAFGSSRGAGMAGRHGIGGTFSFFPSHTISTGEGGVIITDRLDVAQMCQSIRNHGRQMESDKPQHKFNFARFGFNAKMASLQAALGCGVMHDIDKYVEIRHHNFRRMGERLGHFSPVNEGEYIVPHGFPLIYQDYDRRDRAMETLLGCGIECRRLFSCLPFQEPYYMARDLSGASYPIAMTFATCGMYVPCHQNMSDEDVDYVCQAVEQTSDRRIM